MPFNSFKIKQIFGAILVAGFIALFSGVMGNIFFAEQELEENAYPIVVAEGGIASAPVVAQTADPIDDLMQLADAARGATIIRACAACHGFDEGGPNKIGPNLYGVYGNEKGVREGFKYSQALLDKGGIWDVASLNQFLWKPKRYIPGTSMNYIGLRKPEDRADVVKYLQTLE